MHAQTNIQLFNQLRQQGCEPDQLALISGAYRFSLPLFSGRFRASGKTFFAHLVGTASVLGWLQVDGALVAAGLLHAVYTHGDFGDGTHGISDDRRAKVRAVVGLRAEDYIARYAAFPWSFQSIPQLATEIELLSAIDRDIVTLRLANELDEYLDLGMLYCGPNRHPRTTERVLVEIAERLGWPQLADELSRVFEETHEAHLSAHLLDQNAPDESFVISPSSHRRLMQILGARANPLMDERSD